MATRILALVTAYDETTANEEAMSGAAMQFDDLLQVSFTLLIPDVLLDWLSLRKMEGMLVRQRALLTNKERAQQQAVKQSICYRQECRQAWLQSTPCWHVS